MSTPLERIMEEVGQLQDRMAKLEAFIDTPAYFVLSDADQMLLLSQSFVMAHYYSLLRERIGRME